MATVKMAPEADHAHKVPPLKSRSPSADLTDLERSPARALMSCAVALTISFIVLSIDVTVHPNDSPQWHFIVLYPVAILVVVGVGIALYREVRKPMKAMKDVDNEDVAMHRLEEGVRTKAEIV